MLCAVVLAVSASLSCAAAQRPSACQATAADTKADPLAASPPPTTVVIAALPGPTFQDTSQQASARTPSMPSASPAFPEDKAALPSVICGGACPPSFQLGTDSKDQDQVRARIRYCINSSQPPLHAEGTIFVRVEINGKGIGRSWHYSPSLNRGSVPESVRDCIDGLVRTAHFHAENNYSRKHDVGFELKL